MVSGNPNIKMATSIIDYVFRVLGLEYLGRTDLTQVPPELDEPAPDAAPVETVAAAPSAPAAGAGPVAQAVAAPAPPAAKAVRNGNGAHHEAGAAGAATALLQSTAVVDVMSAHLSEMMGDAPFCDTCGHITIRNGSCYKCLNCGNSLGCS
jgi:ribonucleoside-diphosphate reductase alpha chain